MMAARQLVRRACVSWPLSFGRGAARQAIAALFLPLLPMSQRVGNTTLAFARVWHHVDARERVLGGLARSIAVTLMGKNKPVYDPSRDVGDYVVVTNAEHITVTGQKAEKKLETGTGTIPCTPVASKKFHSRP